jgi:adenylyltransferase/sulfurtransferase
MSGEVQLSALNPEVDIAPIQEALSDERLRKLVPQHDVVLDCSDNFATRHAVNRACVAAGVPLVSGAAIRFDGQLAVFDPREAASPCYHCLFPEGDDVQEERCAVMGVFAPLTGIIGTMQAAEALKLMAHAGTPLTGKLLLLDARTMAVSTISVPRDPHCAVCGRSQDSTGAQA